MEDRVQQLILKFKAGEQQSAFAEIYNLYKNPVYYFILMRVKQEQNTEDLMTETFIKAYKHLKRYKPTSRFSTWILTIAKNTVVDFIRTNTRRKHTVLAEAITKTTNSSPEKQLIEKEARKSIDREIELLGFRTKIVAALYFYNDMKYEEICKALDIPMHTVKSSVYRARQILQKKLSVYNEQ